MGKIAILHTTPATLAPLNALIKERCDGVSIENFVDDSILPMLIEDAGTLAYAFEKLLCYASFAQKQHAQMVLCACSSVGGFKDYANGKIGIPVVRIDDAVSDIAVQRGKKIAVLATLPTTLEPSCELLRGKGGAATVITPALVKNAYDALKSGDRPKHDALIRDAAEEFCKENDIVFLAQASMAEAVKGMPSHLAEKVLSSTKPAVDYIAALYTK